MDMKESFGEYVKRKRLAERISLRELAGQLSLSPTYWSDIENGRRSPPAKEKIDMLCVIFELDDSGKYNLYDLATEEIKTTVVDLADYIKGPPIRKALRTAKKLNATERDWKEFEEKLINRGDK